MHFKVWSAICFNLDLFKILLSGDGQICGRQKFQIQINVLCLLSLFYSELRTGCLFDPWLCQYSFRGLMIVSGTGFISIAWLFILLAIVVLEGSQWLGKNAAFHCFEDCCVKRQPVAWKEYCMEHCKRTPGPPRSVNKSGLLQQVVFKCRF